MKLFEYSDEFKKETVMYQFMNDFGFKTWDEFHAFSVSENSKKDFWWGMCQYIDIHWSKRPSTYYEPMNPWYQSRFMIDGKLNYAENLMKNMPEKAIVSINENLIFKEYTKDEVYEQVFAITDYLKKQGVKKGDVICAIANNSAEVIMAMLASTALGCVFTSCSADFGEMGILDRFLQVKPKVLFYHSSYIYNKNKYDIHSVIQNIVSKIKSIEIKIDLTFSNIPNKTSSIKLEFAETNFNDPLFILYTSGTTGKPKGIIHSVGGTLLQHKKEHILHSCMKKDESLLYYTTTGWMMWNWMVSALASGVSVYTYDGSPTALGVCALLEVVSKHQINHFGTSPKYLQTACKSIKKFNFDFSKLKQIYSTGSPLLDHHYELVYENIKTDVYLASISGGTDIISCFMLCNPLLPVIKGAISSIGLGMDIDCVNENCESIKNEKGELICRSSFISMPLGFVDDKDFKKYHDAYFNYFDNKITWRHGDYIELIKEGGIRVFGRSDATLKPGGVRIGTAEIYHSIEKIDFIEDSIIAGFNSREDVEIVLFIVTSCDLDAQKISQIKNSIKNELTPRHVPKHIFKVKEIPYTINLKKMELLVKKILDGLTVDNLNSIKNPHCLVEYQEIALKLNALKS